MDARDAIRALLGELGDGVGCRHRYEPEGQVSFDLLARLGLLRSIDRGVPACVEHGCPLVGRCAFEADFAGKGARRSGRKFRVTVAGRAATEDGDLLRPLAVELLEAQPALASLGYEPRAVFALANDLLEADLAAVDDAGKAPGMTRREVGAALRLLASVGALVLDDDGVTVRRVALTAPD